MSWWTANIFPLSRRDRLLVFLGGILPDLDGIGLLFSQRAYFEYHHIVLHNLLACVIWAIIAAAIAKQRLPVAALTAINWHLHLACDYFGSRGPWDTLPWVLPYLFPFDGGWNNYEFVGPGWYWNPWQWPLDSWRNTLATLIGIMGWVYFAVRLDRTWFEFIWRRFDVEVCRMLRKWFGGQVTEQWSPCEGKVIRRSFAVGVLSILLACVVAGWAAATWPRT